MQTHITVERSFLMLCAEIAKDRFKLDAEEVAKVPGHERLAEQFKKQAAEAANLGLLLADYDKIELKD